MSADDWEAPLQIHWKAQSPHVVGDFTPLWTSSCIVSSRVRSVLAQECSDLLFVPVIEINKDHIHARPDSGPLWWMKVPVVSFDVKKYGWKVAGRRCSECGTAMYYSPAQYGLYWVEEEDLHDYHIFTVRQLVPHIFVRKDLKELIEQSRFTNVEVDVAAILQIGTPPPAEKPPTRKRRKVPPTMPKRRALPNDPLKWRDIYVSFPLLSPNTEESCPLALSEIIQYVQMESADTEEATKERLQFVRTAQIADEKYWLWTYTEADGDSCYVFFKQEANGNTLLGLTNSEGLSPEWYLLAQYYNMVYWS